MRSRLSTALATTAMLAAMLASPLGSRGATVCPPPIPITFGPEQYVDESRAGGEPVIYSHPDGTLLYAAHASTTLLYLPGFGEGGASSSYVNHYQGQSYVYYSTDHGKTWTFVPRDDVPNNIPGSGFSDPDIAIDAAGQVYIAEINLVNIALSRSSDVGRSYTLQNFFAEDMTDREWMDADLKDILYINGNPQGGGTFPDDPVGHFNHTLYRSEDGGATFTAFDDSGGFGKMRVDKRNGTLYEMFGDGDKFEMQAFPKARSGDMTPEVHKIADVPGVVPSSSFDVDRAGGLHVAWTEWGGKRPPGVYYAQSVDAGKTWTAPVRVDRDDKTDYWLTVTAGSAGRAGIAWFQADQKLPDDNPNTDGNHGWHVMAAQVLSGEACGMNPSTLTASALSTTPALPSISLSDATPLPFHVGEICTDGTACEGEGRDRRLGDFFTNAIDTTGAMVISYSDTRKGGAVALSGFTRQVGGPSFLAPAPPPVAPPGPTTGKSTVEGQKHIGKRLPATGLDGRPIAVIGLAALLAAWSGRRWLRFSA